MSLTHRVWAGLWTGTAAAIFENVARIPRMMVITRVLGPELYGILGVFGMFRETVGMLIQMGTGDAVIRTLAASDGGKNTLKIGGTISAAALVRLITIGITTALFFTFEQHFVDYLARYPAVQKIPPAEMYWLLRLLLIGIIIQSLEGPFGNALQGFQAWHALLVVRIIGAIVSTCLPIIAAIMGYKIIGIIVSQQIAFAVIAVLIFFYYSKIVRPKLQGIGFKNGIANLKLVLTFGLPLILSQLFNLIYSYTDQIMLAGMSKGPEELSYYEVARNAALMLSFIPSLLRTVMFPASAAFFVDQNVKKLEALFTFMVKHLFWFLAPLAIWMAALSPLVIQIIAGEKFLSAAPALTILSLLMIMRTFGVPFFTCLVGAFGRTRDQFAISAIGGALNVVLNYWWIPKWGFMGAVYATAAGQFVGFLLAIYFLSPKMDINFPYKIIIFSTGLSIIGAVILNLLSLVYFLIPIFVLPLISIGYLLGIIFLGLLDTQDYDFLCRLYPLNKKFPKMNIFLLRWIRPINSEQRI